MTQAESAKFLAKTAPKAGTVRRLVEAKEKDGASIAF